MPISKNRPADRIIAYIDILGFKELIKTNPNICLSLLKKIQSLKPRDIQRVIKKRAELDERKERDKQVSIFSDLIVISYPDNFFNFVQICAEVMLSLQPLLSKGVIARGVITFGSLYHQKDIIFGEALIEAYELEKKIARYPRVLISDKLIQKLKKEGNEPGLGIMLSKDFDGFCYLDYFKGIKFHPGDYSICKANGRPYLQKVRKKIVANLKNTKISIDAISKWRWLANQFNKYIKEEKMKDIMQIPF